MIYKVSYVIRNHPHPGAIMDLEEMPKVGDTVTLGGIRLVLVEVMELMPARGDFGFYHATCEPLEEE